MQNQVFGLADSPTSGIQSPTTAVEQGVFITVHGHFYQPPREHPHLETITQQPGAAPAHDWNERIYQECYRPNAFARIFNDRGEVIDIVNNYEYLSFNIGPTLLSWLERYDPEVYQRILEGDRHSCQRLQGHGNAIAQVYNHVIMPLANRRDKVTQIRWGKADFRARFGREPEGMWLAEAAVDYSTLEVLIAEGIRFIILAPSQAQRCRPLPELQTGVQELKAPELGSKEPESWLGVGGSQIDPTRPYRCFLPEGDRQQDYIDIFFYDGPISRDLGFGEVLNSSQHFASRLAQAVRGDHRSQQLIAVATDGETFGHHKRGTEKALAYAFTHEIPQQGWTLTNFAHYLSLCPPTWEVELKPVTAWSCSHGVDRWQSNCGCGGGGGWHQQWRQPLRQALDWLRDRLQVVYTEAANNLLRDPWQARDEYIQIILGRGLGSFKLTELEPQTQLEYWLAQHQHHPLSDSEQVDALRLLEMQRHTLLMYTSCGWFFDEISRPEGAQILRYAARAMELSAEVSGVRLEAEFIEKLSLAPSNVPQFGHGGEVYRQLVEPYQLTLEQLVAHYAINSLFTSYPEQHRLFCYQTQQSAYQLQRVGVLTLAMGQIQITSELTREMAQLNFAVLHLGGWDFHCCVAPFKGRRHYSELHSELFAALQAGSAAQIILSMTAGFGGQDYGLSDLLPEERQRLMHLLSQETLTRLDQLYTQVYRDNYGLIIGFQRDGLVAPQELQVAAEIALSHRVERLLRGLEQSLAGPGLNAGYPAGSSYLTELEALAQEARLLGCQLKLQSAQPLLERLIDSLLWPLLQELQPTQIEQDLPRLQQLLQLANHLQLDLNLERAQELYLSCLQHVLIPQSSVFQSGSQDGAPQSGAPQNRRRLNSWSRTEHQLTVPPALSTVTLTRLQLQQLLQLGEQLQVEVAPWLVSLSQT